MNSIYVSAACDSFLRRKQYSIVPLSVSPVVTDRRAQEEARTFVLTSAINFTFKVFYPA